MAISKKVSYTFDPFELVGKSSKGITSSKKKEILDEVSDFVVESILSRTARSESSVKGVWKFPKLSKQYLKKKRAE